MALIDLPFKNLAPMVTMESLGGQNHLGEVKLVV